MKGVVGAHLRRFRRKLAFFSGVGIAIAVTIVGLVTGVPRAARAQSSGAASAVQQLLPPGTTPQQVLQQLEQGQQPSSTTGSTVTPLPAQQVLSPSLQGTPTSPAVPGSVPTVATPKPPSALEALYSQRVGTPITQFGYDLVANGGTVYATLNGAIQNDYILGPGDQINVNLEGQENSSFTVTVDRNGQVILPKIAPIAAGGRRFGSFRADLEAAVEHSYPQTKVYISIGQIRQISVRVVGAVANPGVYAATGLSTVLDALNLAGGIDKSGTLRNVILVRDGKAHSIDLYSMLLPHVATPDLVLAQGDRVIVPPIGATVAITGNIARPGIYELAHGHKTITEAELLSLGNGPQMRGLYREMVLRIMPDGKQNFVDLSNQPRAMIGDSEVLFVNLAVNYIGGQVTLAGDVRVPGQFALNKYPTLRDLLPSRDVFAPAPYMLLGLIVRIDPHSLQKTIMPFSPLHVLEGKENAKLSSEDLVYIMTLPEMQALVAALVPGAQPVQNGVLGAAGLGAQSAPAVPAAVSSTSTATSILTGSLPSAAGVASVGQSTALASLPGLSTPSLTQTPGSSAAPATGAVSGAIGSGATTLASVPGAVPGVSIAAPSAGISSVAGLSSSSAGILSLAGADVALYGPTLAEDRATLGGAVHIPGAYLIAPGTTLAELVAAANGLDSDVDLSAFEVTSIAVDNKTGVSTTNRRTYSATPAQLASLTLQPYDTILFRKVYGDQDEGSVSVQGEVRYPGTYNILRGEKLSSLLARAGGLTEVAYPFGSVFTRQSVADQEHQAFVYQANELEDHLAAYLSSSQITPDAVTYMQGLTQRLRTTQATGRVAVVADPAQLAVRPEDDIILQPGDQLTIPRRPSSVAVMGEVLNPTAVLYRPNLSVDDYIQMAGGTTETAEDSMTFIVEPDGSAYPAGKSMWSFSAARIAPGATIVVPRDIMAPLDWLTLTDDVAKIVSELAITGASLSVISRGSGG